jgi:signal peptidase I
MRGHQPDILRLFEDILRNGTDLRVRVTGRSMTPFLKGGEVLTIRQMPCVSLKKGDLILYRDKNDLPVLHRIIQKRKGDDGTFCFLTKGDALIAFDGEIREDNVLGKVLRIERPAQSGKTTHIDMNSLFYRCMNFSIAVAGFFKTQTYFFLSGAIAKRT